MSLDTIQWLADRAGWAWLAEVDGVLRMNARARDLLADATGSFDELAPALADLSPNAVAAAVDRTELAGRDGRKARWIWGDTGKILLVVPAPVERPSVARDQEMARAVGHELGNALGALVGWIGMLRENPESLTSETLARLERAASTARRAARDLVGGPDDEPAHPAEVLQDVARLLEPTANARGTTIHVDDGGVGPDGLLRRGELFRVVWNLALNAVQMTRDGNVTLRVSTGGGRLLLQVEDDGPGMGPETRARIFESGYGEREGGTGLGLGLVARTVRTLHGTVRVQSELGEGTLFEIRLPSAPRTSEVMPRIAAPSRVLVVEDDAGIRELVETTLSLRKVEATVVASIADAQAAASAPFDLVLADLSLPDGRGDELLADLKARGLARRTLLMSGHVDPGRLAGPPDGWLAKPFDVPELVAAIEGRSATQDAKAS